MQPYMLVVAEAAGALEAELVLLQQQELDRQIVDTEPRGCRRRAWDPW